MIILNLLSVILLSLIGIQENQSVSFTEKYKLSPDIVVLDFEKPVKSINELSGLLQGSALYIDRWATWCGPCIAEFKYKDKVHKFLDENKIKLVYLNSDKDLTEEKWIKFIKKHKLSGYHLRLSIELKEDLTKQGYYIPLIPQYLIINKNGKLVENNALRPSDGVDLYSQLKELAGN